MFLLVPAHLCSPRPYPESCKTVVVVIFPQIVTPDTVEQVVAVDTKMAQYVSGMCPRHVCSICTHCLRHTYLARKLYHHLR